MKKVIVGALLLCFMLTVLPVWAIQVCHDFTMFRLTGVDPVGGTSCDKLRIWLDGHGYKKYPITNAVHRPDIDRVLKPGFVVIVGNDHSGIVNAEGKIEHFLQDPNRFMHTYKVTKNYKEELPKGPIVKKDNPELKGGYFPGDTMKQFMARRGRTPEGGVTVEVWRK